MNQNDLYKHKFESFNLIEYCCNEYQFSKSILPSLIGDRSKNRLIILVSKDSTRTNEGDTHDVIDSHEDSETSNDDEDEEFTPNDEAAYVLLHLLRSKPDDHNDIILQETKDILREGLRSRCKKVDKCVKKCPPKKPKCPKKCKEAFDDLNICRPKKECKKPRCGKTMPPKWLRFN
ncbi:hypothetical protein K1T71_013913 [Dendrolimus kikuchii]|uniref:Uncharacterized protein n=1 Tax=Dendrolimus kikuchii TaxID=765133 RepID=A0ACC1CGH3_9NEOP|nr:hypothetical protein K1T71_013913 [Dendrolimus kikuchii]